MIKKKEIVSSQGMDPKTPPPPPTLSKKKKKKKKKKKAENELFKRGFSKQI